MTSTAALGALIASGIGLLASSNSPGSATISSLANTTLYSNSTWTISGTRSITISSRTSAFAVQSSGNTSPNSSTIPDSRSTSLSISAGVLSSTNASVSISTTPTSTHFLWSTSNTTAQRPFNFTTTGNNTQDTCWDEWQLYWNASRGVTTQVASGCVSTPYTSLLSFTETASPATTSVTTQTFDSIYTNGGFTLSTAKVTTTLTWTLPSQTATTVVYTDIGYNSSCSVTPDVATITTPPCSLPSVASQCQSAWEDVISSGVQSTVASSPPCTQASMDSSQCSWFQASYVQAYGEYIPLPGYVWPTPEPMSRGYVIAENITNVSEPWVWPTATSLAPSCTLGCARCAITGGTIQVLYWPSTTAMPTATPIIATTLNTTLTYPTLYVYFSQVYASDSCSGIGPTVRETIVPITNTAELSSRYVSLTDRGYGGNTALAPVTTIVAPFDLSELVPPVPYSIYSKQDWCQTAIWTQENSAAFFHSDTTIMPTCSTTEPYKPVLFLPEKILQSMDPAWADCSGDVRGVYDPPTALQIATALVGPSTFGVGPVTTSTAQPVASVHVTTATPTAVTVAVPTPTNAPESSAGHSDTGASSGLSDLANASPSRSRTNDVQSSRHGQNTDPASRLVSLILSTETVQSDPVDPAAGSANVQYPTPTATGAANLGNAIASLAAEMSSTHSQNAVGPDRSSLGADQTQGSTAPDQRSDPGMSAPIASAGKTANSHDIPGASRLATVNDPIGSRPGSQATVTAGPESNSGIAVDADGTNISLLLGQVTVVSSHTFSAQSSGSAIVVDGTRTISAAEEVQASVHAVLASLGASRLSNGDLVLTTSGRAITIARGGATTLQGHAVSAAEARGVIVVDGFTTMIPDPSTPTTVMGGYSAIVVSTDGVVVTVSPGQAITSGGHVFSAVEMGGVVVVDGVTTTTPDSQAPTSATDAQAGQADLVVSADGSSITRSDGQALTSGGQVLSAASTSSVGVVDGRTTLGTPVGSPTSARSTTSAGTDSNGAAVQTATSGASKLIQPGAIAAMIAWILLCVLQ